MITAVSNPSIVNDNTLNIIPLPLRIDVPSNKSVIQTGLIFEAKIAQKPNVQTTISDVFRLDFNSSRVIILSQNMELDDRTLWGITLI
jgi:hypothetical protein